MTISSVKKFNIYSDYCCHRSFLSKEECQKLIDLRSSLKFIDGEVNQDGIIEKKSRKCQLSWLPKTSEHDWIFEKIISFLDQVNKTYFKFDIVGLELLQYTVYDEPDDHYKMHIDNHITQYHRKLSFSIQISDPETYKGSELTFWNDSQVAAKDQGSITIFSSFRPHMVTPLESGTRLALVGWASGPPFR